MGIESIEGELRQRISELEGQLAESKAENSRLWKTNKSGAAWAFQQIEELTNENATKEREVLEKAIRLTCSVCAHEDRPLNEHSYYHCPATPLRRELEGLG